MMPAIIQVYEQMSLAVDRDATRLWVLNVGDLKPYERETEFFLTYGWNATRWNPDNLDAFVFAWAQREFDLNPHQADAVVDIVGNLTRFNARRKPELWDSTTYSLTSYREYVLLFLPLPRSNGLFCLIEQTHGFQDGTRSKKHQLIYILSLPPLFSHPFSNWSTIQSLPVQMLPVW